MNTFVAKAKPSSLFFAILGSLVVGPVLGFLVYGALNSFTEMKPSQLIPIFLGVAGIVTVAMLLVTLNGWVSRVELDDRMLRIHRIMGHPQEFQLHNHSFSSQLTHQTRNGQHVSTTRTLKVHGPEGESSFNLTIEPAEYSELINRLTGQLPTGHARPMGQAATPRPLDFQPRRFDINRKQPTRYVVSFWVVAGMFALAGAAFAWFLREEFAAVVALGAIFGVLALVMAVCALILARRASKVAQSVTVAPTWVAFDNRSFNYADLRVIQIKPPGAILQRSAKILTKSGEQVIIPLGLDQYTKMFPDYDTFAEMLEAAGTAAAGVVRLDYS